MVVIGRLRVMHILYSTSEHLYIYIYIYHTIHLRFKTSALYIIISINNLIWKETVFLTITIWFKTLKCNKINKIDHLMKKLVVLKFKVNNNNKKENNNKKKNNKMKTIKK